MHSLSTVVTCILLLFRLHTHRDHTVVCSRYTVYSIPYTASRTVDLRSCVHETRRMVLFRLVKATVVCKVSFRFSSNNHLILR